MSRVVCLLKVEQDRATFTWSEGPASFEPYKLEGMTYSDFQEAAAAAREKLADLVQDFTTAPEVLPQSAFELAAAGYELYETMFDAGADQARHSKQVRLWLENLSRQGAVETLEIVVESPWSLPWNVIYEQSPNQAAFQANAANLDCWEPFWGLRYNLSGGRRVDPLRRMPLFKQPHLLLVIDPEIHDGLPVEDQQRLAEFITKHKFPIAHSRDELQQAIAAQRPDILYWLSHASPDALVLSGEEITPRQLRKLLRSDSDDKFGGLAFLNACQTAEGGASGSFFEALHSVGFAGMIGTEQQTIDTFAHPRGLDFLEAVLDRGEPVGEVMQSLRRKGVPLGLLYGTYCPPEIRVDLGSRRDNVGIQQVHVHGVALGAGTAVADITARALPPLPVEPYPSLAYYDRADRALFAGREDDVEFFAGLLDDATTRILVLHGESGVGKSSFLRAGVIPYLEEECLGYRFVHDRRSPGPTGTQGSVIFIRATNDLFGQLAQALCEFCARPYEYETPLCETVSVDLPGMLRKMVGRNASPGTVRAALLGDRALLGRILGAIGDGLPFTAILIIDQGEEVFTLAQTPEDQQRGREALDMLQRTVGVSGDFKVIFCLRTEYYGRCIDRLRRGLDAASHIREYLLTDFDEDALTDAIRRPTADEKIPYASEIPFQKYGFSYGPGVAEEIARRVVHHTTQHRDSVLPLMQVICKQLYDLSCQRADKTITLADLDALGGIDGGMRNHVEGLLKDLLPGHPSDKECVQRLFTQLYLRQPDGSLTTALLPEDDVRRRWTGRMPFDELLKACCSLRLLRINNLRIGMDEERRYVSLGHDALAKIAAAWDDTLSRGARLRKMAMAVAAVSAVAIVMAVLMVVAFVERRMAQDQEAKAKEQEVKAKKQEIIARNSNIAAEKSQRDAQQRAEIAMHSLADLLDLFQEVPKRAGDIAAARDATEAEEAFSELQSELRITNGRIQKLITEIGTDVENWQGDTASESLRERILGLVAATKDEWELRIIARDSSQQRMAARSELAIERHKLEDAVIKKKLCLRAVKVTQAIAREAVAGRDGILAFRPEFERLYWAELYWVELDQRELPREKRLEWAMIKFREPLNDWEPGEISAATLQYLAYRVRQRCEDLLDMKWDPEHDWVSR